MYGYNAFRYLINTRTQDHEITKTRRMSKQLKRTEKKKAEQRRHRRNRSVTVPLAGSKTLLCKLTLRVCIAGSEQKNRGRVGRRGRVKKMEKR